MEYAIEVKDLVKRYKDFVALSHFDLEVREGEIFGLLGPNGSGKTTTINCILSLLTYDQGDVRVFGKKMTSTSYDLKREIGVVIPAEKTVRRTSQTIKYCVWNRTQTEADLF